MSVFVDIVPPDAVEAAPARAGRNRWRGRLTRAALPLLSIVVFLGAWQLAAASGIWNQTFVPYPSTVWRAFLDDLMGNIIETHRQAVLEADRERDADLPRSVLR